MRPERCEPSSVQTHWHRPVTPTPHNPLNLLDLKAAPTLRFTPLPWVLTPIDETRSMKLPVIALVLFGLTGTAGAEELRADLQRWLPRSETNGELRREREKR